MIDFSLITKCSTVEVDFIIQALHIIATLRDGEAVKHTRYRFQSCPTACVSVCPRWSEIGV